MSAAKQEVRALLNKLPDNCSLEEVRYHLYAIENVQRGIQSAEDHASVPHDEAEKRFAKSTTE